MLCRSAAQQEHYGKKAAAEHGLQFYKHHCRKVSHAADWQRGLRAHKHCPPCGPPKGRPLALRAPGCQEGILSKAVTGNATRSQRHEMPRRGLHLLKAALSRSRISNTPCTSATSSSPPAALSASTERKATSPPSWPDTARHQGGRRGNLARQLHRL